MVFCVALLPVWLIITYNSKKLFFYFQVEMGGKMKTGKDQVISDKPEETL